jgi:hypothetical protein
MSSTIINLIIQLIAGAIGGNAAAAGMEQADLGRAGKLLGPLEVSVADRFLAHSFPPKLMKTACDQIYRVNC